MKRLVLTFNSLINNILKMKFFYSSVIFMVGIACCSQTQPKPTVDVPKPVKTVVKEPIPTQDVHNWFNINTFDSTIAFSKIAKLGKVSVFIVSTSWCGPCKTLKEQLKKEVKYGSNVDFYDINMCYQRRYDDLEKTDAYFYARMYDRLKEWPRVVITSPTGSIIKSFSSEDLIGECIKNQLFEQYQKAVDQKQPLHLTDLNFENCQNPSVFAKTIEILDRLVEYQSRFNPNKVVQNRVQ
jgi:thiol-disulfide isomerase/thioredoxin